MESIWMQTDEDEFACLSAAHQQQTRPFFGIFTDLPERIVSTLKRPVTPFRQPQMRQQQSHFLNEDLTLADSKAKQQQDQFYLPSPMMPESPPTNVSFGFEQQEGVLRFSSQFVSVF